MFKWIMRLLSAAVVVLVLWWAMRLRNGNTPTLTVSTAPTPLPKLSCGDKVIADQRIGKLRIGMSVDSLRKQCPILSDTIQPGPEGTTERVVTVAFAPEVVEAEIVDGRVWRIDIESPAFRSADSLGVGSSVAEVLSRDDPEAGAGEGALYLISRTHCGLSYQLSGGIPARANRHWDKAALSGLPASMEVSKVLVSACGRR